MNAGALKKGDFLNHNGSVYQIVKTEHNMRGRGSANLKFKIKSIANANTVEITCKPVSYTHLVFSTAADNQTQVDIHILQGERPMAKDNKSLGRFILEGIPPAPRGVPQVEVIFDIDANGILDVTAKDKASGKSQSIKITGSSGLSDSEVEKMKEDAEKHAEEDAMAKEKISARNHADSLLHTSEKSLAEAGDKVPADVKSEVEEKMKALKDILEDGSKEDLETKTNELSTSLQKIGQYMYDQQGKADETADNAGNTKDAADDAAGDTAKKDEGTVEEGEIIDEEK